MKRLVHDSNDTLLNPNYAYEYILNFNLKIVLLEPIDGII